MMRRLLGVLALIVFGVVLTACGSVPSATSGAGDAFAEGSLQEIPEYRLGAGDRLRVTVFGETSLSGEFLVSNTGIVSLPLVGDLPVMGLTVREVQRAAEQALSQGFLREPRVSAEVLNYRPFYILGEVTTPGTYPYTADLSVLNAVATAGGFTYRADQRRVFIKRANETEERAYPLTPSARVAPGDTVRIGERFF